MLEIFVLLCSLFDPHFLQVIDTEAELLENKELHENGTEVVLMVGVHAHKVDDSSAVNNDREQKEIPGVCVQLLLHVNVPHFLCWFTLSISVERFCFIFSFLLFDIIVVKLDIVVRLVEVSIILIDIMVLFHRDFVLDEQFFFAISELLESFSLHFSHKRLKRENFDDI